MGKRPPCVKGAVRREERAYDWGIAFRKCEAITMKDNPSDLAALGHLPLHKGGFFGECTIYAVVDKPTECGKLFRINWLRSVISIEISGVSHSSQSKCGKYHPNKKSTA